MCHRKKSIYEINGCEVNAYCVIGVSILKVKEIDCGTIGALLCPFAWILLCDN